MIPKLIILDGEGNLLYSSHEIDLKHIINAWLDIIANDKNCDRVLCGRNAFLVKNVLLTGKRYIFLMDSKMLYEQFGNRISDAANRMFDIEHEEKTECSLKALTLLFINTYRSVLEKEGVRIEVRRLVSDTYVSVPPKMFALALALMVRLTASESRAVKLSFVNECGRVIIFSDATGGEPCEGVAREFLRALLYEVSAAAGFAVEELVYRGKRSFSLSLSPLDISLLGFKRELPGVLEKYFACYIKMF
ncbi:MAG: hypothetical protein IJA60_01175 [Clostridia bacterium]|nr:hypothetical protein [Clostridia bacterium]